MFLKNIGSGWFAIMVTGIVGFITLPLNLHYLGDELYGFTTLVTSFIAIFQIMSFGLPASLLRFFSLAIARKDDNELRRINSTSQFLLSGLGVLGALIALCCYPIFISTYEIQNCRQAELFFLFCTMAFSFAHTFFLIPFYAFIQAKNRFDLGNYNRSISNMLRLITLLAGYSLFPPTLYIYAASNLVSSIYQIISILYLAGSLDRNNAFFQKKYFSLSLLPSLFSFSFLTLIDSFCFSMAIQGPILVMGKTLGPKMVASFVPATVLCSFFASLFSSICVPLTPLSSKNDVEKQGNNLGQWTIDIGEVLSLVGSLLVVIFIICGRDIITLWLGDEMVWICPTVVVMIAGLSISSIQTATYSLALGSKTIIPFVCSSVTMSVCTTAGALVGTKFFNWGILEVAQCIAVTRILIYSVYITGTYSRIFHYDYLKYLWCVYFKPILLAALTVCLTLGIQTLLPQYRPSLFKLIPVVFILSLFYAVIGWKWFLSPEIKCRITFVNSINNKIHQKLKFRSVKHDDRQ